VVKWDWEPSGWKRSMKLLLGIATVWPPIYMVLFIASIFSMFLFLPFADDRSNRRCGDLDLLQLDQKIKNGEIKQLTVRPTEIVAWDRVGNCEFEIFVSNESTRERILNEAREIVNEHQRVEKIEEETTQPASSRVFPIGIAFLFGAHMITILLIIGLMPLYIILAVKSDHHDQTMRIIWVVLICMLGMFAMPVYWYLYIWRKRQPSSPVANAS